jgi:hypothetical protein
MEKNMIDQEMTEAIAIKSHLKTLEHQYFLQRIATFLVFATFSLVLLATPTGIALSSDSITNEALNSELHKFAGHGLIIVAASQVVVLFLGRKFHIANPSTQA